MSMMKIIKRNKGIIVIVLLAFFAVYLLANLMENKDESFTGRAIADLFVNKKFSLQIEDKCGIFYNLFTHTVNDENDCRTKCKNQCNAQDAALKSVEFEYGVKTCNHCTCYCRG